MNMVDLYCSHSVVGFRPNFELEPIASKMIHIFYVCTCKFLGYYGIYPIAIAIPISTPWEDSLYPCIYLLYLSILLRD